MKLYEIIETEKWMLEASKKPCPKCGCKEVSIYQRTLLAQVREDKIRYAPNPYPVHVAECAECGEEIMELWD